MRKARLIDLLVTVEEERKKLSAENIELRQIAARLRDMLLVSKAECEDKRATCNERTKFLNEYTRAFNGIKDLVRGYKEKIDFLTSTERSQDE